MADKEYPHSVTESDKCQIDWEKTTAWGWRGYYARVFLNVDSREPNGKIPPMHTTKSEKN
jgi:predicted AlkP superfamily phosphohydrolase/phosphomutase